MNSRFLLIALTTAAPALPLPALAQPFPSKPIRIMVAYPPGGVADVIARTIGHALPETLGQQVVIENRTGAQGIVGTATAAKAPADGYTILLSDFGTLTMNPWLYASPGYDPIKDFAYIGLVADYSIAVVVHPGVPATNLKELAALAKAKPDRITFASGSASGQLTGELFKILARIQMVHVPYKGGAPAAVDLAGGHVDLMIAAAPSVVPLVRAGKLRAIAVTGPARTPALPGVSTSRESGFPDFEMTGWNGLAAPANTPKDVVARLHRDVSNLLKTPGVTDKLVAAGFEPRTSSPEEMTELVKSEYGRWGKVVKTAGIKTQQ